MTMWADPSLDLADWAAEHLGLPSSPDPDPVQFGQALALAAKGLAGRPADVAAASARFAYPVLGKAPGE